MNVFIIFVKFLSWIITNWTRLARHIWEEEGIKFWKGTQLQK